MTVTVDREGNHHVTDDERPDRAPLIVPAAVEPFERDRRIVAYLRPSIPARVTDFFRRQR